MPHYFFPTFHNLVPHPKEFTEGRFSFPHSTFHLVLRNSTGQKIIHIPSLSISSILIYIYTHTRFKLPSIHYIRQQTITLSRFIYTHTYHWHYWRYLETLHSPATTTIQDTISQVFKTVSGLNNVGTVLPCHSNRENTCRNKHVCLQLESFLG